MSIVMISSMSHSGREELARSLAQKTGWPILSREELVDQAAEKGIKTGRLEISVIKTPGMSEKLAREKVLYLSFLTAALCEKAREGNLIYHGRAGHLLLPGVTHRLRVGVTAPMEVRVKKAMAKLNISEDKALGYLDQLDEDMDKWIRSIHKTDRREPDQYDLFVNLQNMGVGNAASVICQMAELPDFRTTPASLNLMADQDLAARARLRLAFDDQTGDAELEVRADNGVLTVTYPPRQEINAADITKVLEDLEGCREIQCTMAETNILWVQEDFNPESENFDQIIQLAQRWGAAVELLQYLPLSQAEGAPPEEEAAANDRIKELRPQKAYNGGVEDDSPEPPAVQTGLIRTAEELVAQGRFSGQHTVRGGHEKILETATGGSNYSLVVIGDMFLSKGHSTRTRQTRELTLAIRDRLKAPVIMADEMKSKFLFGKKQALKLVGFSAITVLIYFLVFTNQKPIMNFIGGEMHNDWKLVGSVAVALFVPMVAFLYSTVTGLLLKLINMD